MTRFFRANWKIYALGIFVFLISCKSDDDSPAPKTDTLENGSKNWKSKNLLSGRARLVLNSNIQDDVLTLATADGTYRYGQTVSDNISVRSGTYFNSTIPAISKKLALFADDNTSEFILSSSHYELCDNFNNTFALFERYHLEELDTTIFSSESRFVKGINTGSLGSFNSEGKLLAAIRNDKTEHSQSLILFNFLDADVNSDPCILDKPTATEIESINTKVFDFVLFIESIGTDWYVHLEHRGLIKIDSQGNVIETSLSYLPSTNNSNELITSVFSHRGKLYAYSLARDKIHESTDGVSWNTKLDNIDVAGSSFTSIGDSLVYYGRGPFGDIGTIDLNTGTTRKLDKANLDQKFISSVVDYMDEVWVTTYEGIYYKTKEEFFESKPEN